MYLERKNLKNLLLRYLDEGFHFQLAKIIWIILQFDVKHDLKVLIKSSTCIGFVNLALFSCCFSLVVKEGNYHAIM